MVEKKMTGCQKTEQRDEAVESLAVGPMPLPAPVYENVKKLVALEHVLPAALAPAPAREEMKEVVTENHEQQQAVVPSQLNFVLSCLIPHHHHHHR